MKEIAEKKGASRSLRKSTRQMTERFQLISKAASRHPRKDFDYTVDQIEMLIREVAEKAFAAGARHGATTALDAVLSEKITYEDKVLWFYDFEKPLNLDARTVGGPTTLTFNDLSFDVGPVELTATQLGFDVSLGQPA